MKSGFGHFDNWGDSDMPVAFVKFAPPTLASEHLEALRGEFVTNFASQKSV